MNPTSADRYLDPASKPFPFCPGCSHGTVLDALAEALARLELPPERVALVTDIGCIGISDRHFRTHIFHGLHGRSVTYACGLKLANPELTVVVLVGDGGLGIGGHHFLHAARRNVDITVLVCNNFNFGMTGGQHSVTSPHGSFTATTSEGNYEHPLDVTGLVDVAQGNFAARALYHDPALPDLMARALRAPGFAAVEVWEMCTAYFAKRNKVSRRVLDEMLAERGLTTGVVVERDRPGYLAQVQQGLAKLRGAKSDGDTVLEPRFPRTASGRRTLLLAGRAGQKVRSSAILLGRAAALCDLHVTQRDDYPVTVMTGHSTAEMIFQPEPINELGVDVPDTVIITAPEGLAVVAERLAALPETSTVFTVSELLPIKTRARVVPIPAREFGPTTQRTQLVLGCVAWVARQIGLVPVEALEASASMEARQEIAAANLNTLASVIHSAPLE
jgi:2-oxoglutarate ferredoxin oxidoreductase subunit beta